MINFIKSFLGIGAIPNFAEKIKQGAIIIDVRSVEEFENKHIKGSINIPLNALSMKLNKLDKSQVIITCCASGIRSASAKSILLANGFESVYNGREWHSLNQKIKAQK